MDGVRKTVFFLLSKSIQPKTTELFFSETTTHETNNSVVPLELVPFSYRKKKLPNKSFGRWTFFTWTPTSVLPKWFVDENNKPLFDRRHVLPPAKIKTYFSYLKRNGKPASLVKYEQKVLQAKKKKKAEKRKAKSSPGRTVKICLTRLFVWNHARNFYAGAAGWDRKYFCWSFCWQ